MASTTQALDHLILFLPVDPATKLPACPKYFQDSFTLTPGGFHADGATSNTLILLADGCYIELISFVATDLAPGHWWGPDASYVGWKDWCLTNASRPEDSHGRITATHGEPIRGGRKRADGMDVKWAVTFPNGDTGGQAVRGRIPFFCHDVTPRSVRVPMDEEKTTHPSGALGVLELTVIVKDQVLLEETRSIYSSILGGQREEASGEISFQAARVHNVDSLGGGPKIILRFPKGKEEQNQAGRLGFICGNVVLGAESTLENPKGSRVRLDSADGGTGVGGLWMEYI